MYTTILFTGLNMCVCVCGEGGGVTIFWKVIYTIALCTKVLLEKF